MLMSSDKNKRKPENTPIASRKVFQELAVKNVKKSARDYLIYFFTLMFSVCLFYTFNSISSQFSMLGIDDSQNFLTFASGMILTVSVFICMMIGALIVYANRFLLKRRKKEIGIYITLGMEENDILGLLMRETLLIGGISLVSGMIAGIFLSQGLALITAKLIGVGFANLHFFFSVSAAIKSVLFFAAVFAFVHFFNAKEIKKLNLIDLIYADRKNEVLEIEGNKKKVLLFLGAVIFLLSGYVWVLTRVSVNMGQAVGIGMVLIVTGTILFFMSVADIMIEVLKRRKKFYYSGLNMFVIRQLASKMKSNILSMTVISILMFASVTTMAVGLGGGKSIMEGAKDSAPFDISFTEFAKGTEYGEIDKDLTELSIAEKLNDLGLHTQDMFYAMAELSIYDIDGVNGSLFLSQGDKENSYLDQDTSLPVISVEDYNKAMKLLGKPEITLGSKEFALNYNVKEVQQIYETFAEHPGPITVNGTSLQWKKDGLYRSSYKTSLLLMDQGTVIVPKEVLKDLKPDWKVLNGMFANSGEQGYAAFEEEWLKLPYLPQWQAKEQAAVQIFSDTIIFSYIGIYLGIIFLITAGAVLALQQLSQSADSVKRYQLLDRLGTEEEVMRGSILSQLLIYFGIPIGIAGIHSAVIISGFYVQFTNLPATDVIQNILFAVVTTGVIYSIYFITTYIGSFRILDRGSEK